MASRHLDARSAFERLRAAARSRRRQVADLAAGLLQGESLDRT
jgi:AmiR/NasT family two-component response regulator